MFYGLLLEICILYVLLEICDFKAIYWEKPKLLFPQPIFYADNTNLLYFNKKHEINEFPLFGKMLLKTNRVISMYSIFLQQCLPHPMQETMGQ